MLCRCVNKGPFWYLATHQETEPSDKDHSIQRTTTLSFRSRIIIIKKETSKNPINHHIHHSIPPSPQTHRDLVVLVVSQMPAQSGLAPPTRDQEGVSPFAATSVTPKAKAIANPWTLLRPALSFFPSRIDFSLPDGHQVLLLMTSLCCFCPFNSALGLV